VSGRSNGFTLIELLVVLAIIAALAALTAGAMSQMQAARNQTESASRLHQWGVALASYAAENDGYMPRRGQGVQPLEMIDRPEDWFNALPPFAGESAYVDLVKNGRRPQAGDHSIFVRPGAKDPGATVFLSYGMNMNLSPWNLPLATRITQVEQAASTVFMAESPGPYASTFPSAQPYGCVAPYNGKGNILFLDGHVRLLDGTYIGAGSGDPHRPDVRWLTGTASDAQAGNY
jgi:prepilin-type N-terminal cleavage/methylation domain-containing protein/prepilin-type processing-associated H-X9-DG protein